MAGSLHYLFLIAVFSLVLVIVLFYWHAKRILRHWKTLLIVNVLITGGWLIVDNIAYLHSIWGESSLLTLGIKLGLASIEDIFSSLTCTTAIICVVILLDDYHSRNLHFRDNFFKKER